MKRTLIFLLTLVIVFGISVHSHATLTVIGTASYDSDGDGITENYKLIYDNDSPFGSIVWLDYTNDINNWANQVNWASGLNNAGVLTYNLNPGVNVTWGGGWRLPETVDDVVVPDTNPNYYNGIGPNGYNITTSEMGHLYYSELGNLGYCDTAGNCPQTDWPSPWNLGDFEDVRPYWVYWSGTEYAADPNQNQAWCLSFNLGHQNEPGKSNSFFALAVRPANVPPPVAEEQIEAIQEFFDEMVTSGKLVGLGATKTAAAGKLYALGNMLEEAEYLIDSGYIEEACNQLNAVYMKTDGAILPPDFVTGDAADELAAQILALMDTLGCE